MSLIHNDGTSITNAPALTYSYNLSSYSSASYSYSSSSSSSSSAPMPQPPTIVDQFQAHGEMMILEDCLNLIRSSRDILSFISLLERAHGYLAVLKNAVRGRRNAYGKLLSDVKAVMAIVFEHLQASDLLQVECVCRGWREASSGAMKAWKQACELQGWTMTSLEVPTSWRQRFREGLQIEQKWATGSYSEKQFFHGNAVNTLAAAEGIFVSGGTGDIKLWDISTRKAVRTLNGHISVRALETDGRLVYSGGADSHYWETQENRIKVWDVETGIVRRNFVGHKGLVQALASEGKEGKIHLASGGHMIKIWNIETGACLKILDQNGSHGGISSLVFRQSLLYSVGNDSNVRAWDLKSGEMVQNWTAHTGAISCIMADDRGQLVTGSQDKTVKTWDLEGGSPRCSRILEGQEDEVKCISVQGNRIVTGTSSGIKVWNTELEKPLGALSHSAAALIQCDQERLAIAPARESEPWRGRIILCHFSGQKREKDPMCIIA